VLKTNSFSAEIMTNAKTSNACKLSEVNTIKRGGDSSSGGSDNL